VFCRVTHVHAPASASRVHEGLKIWYDNVLPVTKARDGFRVAISMVDLETGKALSITFWEGEDDLIASTEADYHKQAIKRCGEFFESAHDPETSRCACSRADVRRGVRNRRGRLGVVNA
jgi:hypothetical protein